MLEFALGGWEIAVINYNVDQLEMFLVENCGYDTQNLHWACKQARNCWLEHSFSFQTEEYYILFSGIGELLVILKRKVYILLGRSCANGT